MKIVQCFKCERHVDEDASVVVQTTDAESYGAPPVKRVWCGSCLREVRENTEEALSDMAAVSEEDSDEEKDSEEEDGWITAASMDEVRQLLEND